jgi:AcrR family transcriptional regulator
MTDVAPGRRGPGRPAGAGDTRQVILDAARAEFAAKGYDAASVRAIARAAGVDPALVHHYFGPKEKVFVAAMDLPIAPGDALPDVLAGGVEGLGERLVRLFLSLWSDPAFRGPMLGMLRSASTGEQGAAMLREFVSGAMLGRVGAVLEGPDAALRVNLAAAQMVGVVLLRFVVGVEPLASATDEEVVALVAPTLQRYLDGGS